MLPEKGSLSVIIEKYIFPIDSNRKKENENKNKWWSVQWPQDYSHSAFSKLSKCPAPILPNQWTLFYFLWFGMMLSIKGNRHSREKYSVNNKCSSALTKTHLQNKYKLYLTKVYLLKGLVGKRYPWFTLIFSHSTPGLTFSITEKQNALLSVWGENKQCFVFNWSLWLFSI